MKKFLLVFLGIAALAIIIYSVAAQDKTGFDHYFIDRTMRIDYYHTGNHQEEIVALDRVYQQGVWAGPIKNLLDPFMRGRYCAKIYEAASGQLIYSRAFDSLFGEYRTTDEALKGSQRTF
ncbi:MAG: hypothetical protein NUW07_08070, partial [Candidatus Saccharicenans sp.]|nr:hypothetical protein [Candidatus Saccharicenans sp.]